MSTTHNVVVDTAENARCFSKTISVTHKFILRHQIC